MVAALRFRVNGDYDAYLYPVGTYNKIDWNNISLEKNTKAFDESISSISSIKGIIRIMTYSIILRWYCNTINDINIMDKRKNT